MFYQNFDNFFDRIVTKTQTQFFGHKSVLKLKNLRKRNQPGIKFYNIEYVEFISRTFLTEISQNFSFPHFQLFQIFAHVPSQRDTRRKTLCKDKTIPEQK